MAKRSIYPIILLLVFSIFENSYALAPVESLVLGNFSEEYSENKTDPLEFVFGRDISFKNEKIEDFKRSLVSYRGFYEEGKNLVNYCSDAKSIRYATDWEKIQNLRMIISEAQYIGLDVSTRAIGQYAKYFDFTDENYQNLADDLVDNYCSNNLTVISKKELKNNLLLKFKKENTFILPTVKDNPLFPNNMDKYISEKRSRDQEFKTTIKLFQSLCSWNGDPLEPGLMTPILKHGALMAFFNRQLNGKSIDWNPKTNSTLLVDDNKTIRVNCENLVCRKTNATNFLNKIKYAIGSSNYFEDFKNLYCDSFAIMDYTPKSYDPKIAKMMKDITFDEENFLNSQFIALLTGVPDFMLGLEKFTDGVDVFRSGIDYTWSNWAKKQTSDFSRELYFEEPLTLELIDRKLVFNPYENVMRVGFDVNLGEFDRINQQIGKIRLTFNLNVNKKMLYHVREKMRTMDLSIKSEKLDLMNRFKLQLERDINVARDRLIIPPWKGDLALIIARELTEQMLLMDDKFFQSTDSGMRAIQVQINYSPFALKYLNHQHNIFEKDSELKTMTSSH